MIARQLLIAACCLWSLAVVAQEIPVLAQEHGDPRTFNFQQHVRPLLSTFCVRCHDAEKMESGIRVDQIGKTLNEKQLFLGEQLLKQVSERAMPPSDQPQPTDDQRRVLIQWIRGELHAAKTRDPEKHGSLRRLTIAQYRNTLADLLGIKEDLTDALPPDSVSTDGFLNNESTMLLSPLLIEAYFEVAEKALDRCIVDENQKPVIQTFRMEFGKSINPQPCPDKLILGANSHLLANEDFLVRQLTPKKPFSYDPLSMQTRYRFIEGYQGNATVRGWRDYNSIYHAVFACLRGTEGYPKGKAYETVTEGLLLRPAIPSSELFGQSSTYGPKANFKISLRELPDHGNFRVTVRAARCDDGLLLDKGTRPRAESGEHSVTARGFSEPVKVEIPQSGIYQVDVFLNSRDGPIEVDDSHLNQGLIGAWSLDGDTKGRSDDRELVGKIAGEAEFVDSPFGKAISLDGDADAVVVPRHDGINVGAGDFTVAAWIHPRQLRQSGIVCLGGYGYTHGWLFDMPDSTGVLRLETAKPGREHNGTVKSRAGVIRENQWQHVAAVVRRGENQTRLFVNGYQVAVGTIGDVDLDNPDVALHIGRIQNAQLFKGEIDEVRLYRRALQVAEIEALVQPGLHLVQPPPPENPQDLLLTLGNRSFSRRLDQAAFMVVRLPAGPLNVKASYGGNTPVTRIVFTRLNDSDPLTQEFRRFETRSPRLGVFVGLRRDCGSTLNQVGGPQDVKSPDFHDFVFTDAINNYPSPDVEEDNVNYLAGVREIGVRSLYTDGRDMPRLLIRSVEFEGPYYESWPPATHQNIFIESDHQANPSEYAGDIIRSFASRAFRRPITADEAASLLRIWKTCYAQHHDFQQSIKDTLLVVLTSPQFLFLIESSDSPQPESLDSYELASKLSYFLWNTAPDDRLLQLAAAGNLRTSLNAEIDRLIDDPRFDQFANEFASQWFGLDKFDVVEVNQQRYPSLTRDTKAELRKEPACFLKYLISNNLPLAQLLDSDFVVANEVVARYYGLSNQLESGFRFVPVAHGDEKLGGLLCQAAILAGLSDGRESNPVKRGAWLARKIIAEPPDDPPPNVPELPADEDQQLTLREKLERHRNQQGCAKCHAGIDPWGIPFEQYDAAGLLKPGPVDTHSTLPDNTQVANLNELKEYLANDRIDQVAFSFLKHLATYATGRSLSYNEIEFLKQEGIQLKRDGYLLQDMIRFVATSKLFLEK